MGSDDLHKKNKRGRQQRKEVHIEMLPLRYLIVCEGEKTEPNYFIGLSKPIEDKFRKKNREFVKIIKSSEFKNFINIEGTGRNTESLVNLCIQLKKKATIPFGSVWVVFDKDSFPDEQFENAIKGAEENNISVAWSNEAIELWFLLHFEYLNSAITREQYSEKLDIYFSQLNINNGKYEKNLKNIYELLNQYGNSKNAIKFAKKLLDNQLKPSNNNPATTVFQLVEELENLK